MRFVPFGGKFWGKFLCEIIFVTSSLLMSGPQPGPEAPYDEQRKITNTSALL